MDSRLAIDLFVEDQAHEKFIGPLVSRVAKEEDREVDCRFRSARGGHGRAIEEFRAYQVVLQKGGAPASGPDIIVVGIDGNCTTFAKKRKEILDATRPDIVATIVAASPDPHVERWYLADPVSFAKVVGFQPAVGKSKCDRVHYKTLLSEAVRGGGHPPTLGGIEFAAEIVGAMDLYRASKADHSLGAFVKDLRQAFQATV